MAGTDPVFRGIAADMVQPMTVDVVPSRGTDILAFASRGIPSANLVNLNSVRSTRGFGHTRADTIEKVSVRMLQHVSAQVARILLRLSSMEFSARHRSMEEVLQVYRSANLLRAIQIATPGVLDETE